MSELPIGQPSHCPFCRSDHVTATNQKLTASTYWRCEACGQVWHPDRLRSGMVVRRERR